MKITINAGHYPGRDSGAIGQSGVQEADINRDIMERVAVYLRDIEYEVLEVQENILSQITDASNAFGTDLFVSIHCNGSNNTLVRGTETFCYNAGGESEKLAICIQNQVISSMGTIDRGVKNENFYVLRMTNCPAVLVEIAFITNEEDEKILVDQNMQDQFAGAIARGITDYICML